MKPDKLSNEDHRYVFGPSLILLGTVSQVFIIDMIKLGRKPELDIELTKVFKNTNGILIGFGMQIIIYYFEQFYPHY